MTAADFYTLTPIIILALGSLLCLLAGAIRPGGYLYLLAGALIAVSILFSLFNPNLAIMPGIAITNLSRFFMVFFNFSGLVALMFAAAYNKRRRIEGEEYPSTFLSPWQGWGWPVPRPIC